MSIALLVRDHTVWTVDGGVKNIVLETTVLYAVFRNRGEEAGARVMHGVLSALRERKYPRFTCLGDLSDTSYR